MRKISLRKIEKQLKVKLNKKVKALGIDTASRTGWCVAQIVGTQVVFDYGFVKLESQDKYFRYNHFIDLFESLIQSDMAVVIEESFYGFNVKSFQFLSRIGMIAYMAAYQKGCTDIEFLMATQARSRLGIRGNSKKRDVQKEFKTRLNIRLDDEDIIDAIILAICGLVK